MTIKAQGMLAAAACVTVILLILLILLLAARAQLGGSQTNNSSPTPADLERQVSELRQIVAQLQAERHGMERRVSDHSLAPAEKISVALGDDSDPLSASSILMATAPNPTASDRKVLDFLHETTFNVALDGHYEYNFDRPIGRVNLLRAYDVNSNSFSPNQAALVIEIAPDVAKGKRFGASLDFQFGQATETLQGSAVNEARPAASSVVSP